MIYPQVLKSKSSFLAFGIKNCSYVEKTRKLPSLDAIHSAFVAIYVGTA